MLYLRIPNPSALLKPTQFKKEDNVVSFLSKEEILNRQLKRLIFSIGDEVRFKKPKRNPVKGTITNIIEDAGACPWVSGDKVPMNIVVFVPDGPKGKGIVVKTNMKKLLLVRTASQCNQKDVH